MKPALIVIDMLNDFFVKLPLSREKTKLIKKTNELIAHARKKKVPILWVKQEYKPNLSDAPLATRKRKEKITIKGTRGAQILEGLDKKKDKVIVKKRYSGFFKTNLESCLKKHKIDTLILMGINTHACVRTTAIDAYQKDYQVIIAKDAVSSWDKQHHRISMTYFKKGMLLPVLTNAQIKRKLR